MMNFARRARKLGGVDAKAIGNCGASFYTENDGFSILKMVDFSGAAAAFSTDFRRRNDEVCI